MMKEEFEKRLGKEIDIEEYEVIEFVYMFHPSLDVKDDPKGQIAKVYKEFGMPFIRGMVAGARLQQEYEEKLRQIQADREAAAKPFNDALNELCNARARMYEVKG